MPASTLNSLVTMLKLNKNISEVRQMALLDNYQSKLHITYGTEDDINLY